jgi:hypothetical protein
MLPEHCERDIAPEMVKVAAAVLEESGLLEYWSDGPALLIVRKMLEVALSATVSTSIRT